MEGKREKEGGRRNTLFSGLCVPAQSCILQKPAATTVLIAELHHTIDHTHNHITYCSSHVEGHEGM